MCRRFDGTVLFAATMWLSRVQPPPRVSQVWHARLFWSRLLSESHSHVFWSAMPKMALLEPRHIMHEPKVRNLKKIGASNTCFEKSGFFFRKSRLWRGLMIKNPHSSQSLGQPHFGWDNKALWGPVSRIYTETFETSMVMQKNFAVSKGPTC